MPFEGPPRPLEANGPVPSVVVAVVVVAGVCAVVAALADAVAFVLAVAAVGCKPRYYCWGC